VRIGDLSGMTQIDYPEPDLFDELVRLRRWRMSDLRCVEEAASDPQIPEGTTVPAVYTEADGRAWIERQQRRQPEGRGLSFAIADVASDEAVGLIVLMLRQMPGTAGIGYWLIPRARRRGRGTRAIRMVSRWAIADAGMARIEAVVEPHNEPSLRALRKSGFVTEGVLRSHLHIAGSHRDVISLSLIAADLA
jgi:ribosomal-protein-alanine N-acetyltransferase